MKITFTQHRELAGGRIVRPGDTLESPRDASEELLAAYITNGIAIEATSGKPAKITAYKQEAYHVE